MSEEEFALDQSVAKLGRLVPIIKDANGNIIDGFHRKELDPKWEEEFSIKLEHIKDPVQSLLARMNINLCRRNVSAEEKTQWLGELVKLTGWTPKEIAEKSGWSERTVYRYLSKELKAPEPEQLASAKVALEKMPEIPKEAQIEEKPTPVKCYRFEYCGMMTVYPKEWKGVKVCPSCFDKLEHGEISLEAPKPMPPKPAEAPKPPRVEKRVYEPGAWREEMRKPVSRMDQWVAEELIRRGYRIRSQEPICIKFVVPEVIVDGKGEKSFDKPFALFLDTVETHGKRTLVDMENRELLARRGIRVLEIEYESYTEEQRQLVMSEITSAI